MQEESLVETGRPHSKGQSVARGVRSETKSNIAESGVKEGMECTHEKDECRVDLSGKE